LLALLLAPLAAAGQGDEATARIAEAGEALESGSLDDAERLFSEAIDLAPERPLAWLGLSEVAVRRGDLLEALRLARHAEKLAPARPEIVFWVSRQLSSLGRVEEALAELTRFRSLEPDAAEGYLLAASLLRSTNRGPEAIAILEEAVAADVDDPRVRQELALSLLTEGDAERGILVAEEAAVLVPNDGDVLATLGFALAASPERRSEAAEWLEAGLAAGVSFPGRVHMELATLLEERGEPEAALEHLRVAADLAPDSAEVQYKLGAALRNSGDVEGARAALTRYQEIERSRQAAAQEDRNLGTRYNEIQTLANENRLHEALQAADDLLAENPEEDRVLALRAKVLFSLGRLNEALEGIIEARRLVPSQVEYNFLEGMFFLQAGLPAAAELPLNRALALDPELADAHSLLGMTLSSLERYDEAVASFERALELGADSGALRLGYSEALHGAGRLEESRQQLEEYRKRAGG
jgi:tetratricopeptide (TPR) repeat protein